MAEWIRLSHSSQSSPGEFDQYAAHYFLVVNYLRTRSSRHLYERAIIQRQYLPVFVHDRLVENIQELLHSINFRWLHKRSLKINDGPLKKGTLRTAILNFRSDRFDGISCYSIVCSGKNSAASRTRFLVGKWRLEPRLEVRDPHENWDANFLTWVIPADVAHTRHRDNPTFPIIFVLWIAFESMTSLSLRCCYYYGHCSLVNPIEAFRENKRYAISSFSLFLLL